MAANTLLPFKITVSQISLLIPNPLTGDHQTYPFPFGFTPQEEDQETDYRRDGRYKGDIGRVELGSEHFMGPRTATNVYTLNSANVDIYNTTGVPTAELLRWLICSLRSGPRHWM